MNPHSETRGHRSHLARPLLAAVFCLQRLGDVAVIYSTYAPAGPRPILRGVAVASLIWTTALLAGVWRRLRWARYVVTTFCWLYLFALGFMTLIEWQQSPFDASDSRGLPLAGAVLYLGANLILVRSRRVQHLANL